MSVDTGKVADRRTLRFATLGEALADAERISASDRAGTLRCAGNWTAGQIFSHVAAFMDYPYDGYPPELRPPWFIKLVLKPFKRKFLRDGLPAGRKIPGIPAGTVGADSVSTEEGLRRLRAAADRMGKGPPRLPNPIFGPLTHEEWINLNLKHAELHFSFVHPG